MNKQSVSFQQSMQWESQLKVLTLGIVVSSGIALVLHNLIVNQKTHSSHAEQSSHGVSVRKNSETSAALDTESKKEVKPKNRNLDTKEILNYVWNSPILK